MIQVTLRPWTLATASCTTTKGDISFLAPDTNIHTDAKNTAYWLWQSLKNKNGFEPLKGVQASHVPNVIGSSVTYHRYQIIFINQFFIHHRRADFSHWVVQPHIQCLELLSTYTPASFPAAPCGYWVLYLLVFVFKIQVNIIKHAILLYILVLITRYMMSFTDHSSASTGHLPWPRQW